MLPARAAQIECHPACVVPLGSARREGRGNAGAFLKRQIMAHTAKAAIARRARAAQARRTARSQTAARRDGRGNERVFEKANHGACGEGGHRAAGQGRAGATNSVKPDGDAPRWKGECGGVFARTDRPGASPQDTIMIADSMRNRIMAGWRRCAFCMAAAHQIFWAAIEALIAIFTQFSTTRAHLPEKRLTLSAVARGLPRRPEKTLSTLLTQLSAMRAHLPEKRLTLPRSPEACRAAQKRRYPPSSRSFRQRALTCQKSV